MIPYAIQIKLQNLIERIAAFLDTYKPMPTPQNSPQTPDNPIPSAIITPAQILYRKAVEWLGQDASPDDEAPDELACAETVNAIHKGAFGEFINVQGKLSTIYLALALAARADFLQVFDPLPGDIVVSPTKGRIHGHTGIVGKFGIMSNDSKTGRFERNYTLDSWKRSFGNRGLETRFFRKTSVIS